MTCQKVCKRPCCGPVDVELVLRLGKDSRRLFVLALHEKSKRKPRRASGGITALFFTFCLVAALDARTMRITYSVQTLDFVDVATMG